jgi:hypothetical protein
MSQPVTPPGSLPAPPRGSRAALEDVPGGIRLILPRRGWAPFAVECLVFLTSWGALSLVVFGRQAEAVLFGFIVCSYAGVVLRLVVLPVPSRVAYRGVGIDLFTLLWSMGLALLSEGSAAPTAGLVAAVTWMSIAFLRLLDAIPRQATLTAADGRLTVRLPGLVRPRLRTWARHQLAAVGVWNGLWVVSGREKRCLFQDQRDDELRWVAGVIRSALDVPGELPPGPGELRVLCQGSHWPDPEVGLLRVRPGSLAVSHSFSDRAHLIFRAGKDVLVYQTFRRGLPVNMVLTPVDMTCRVAEDGSTCLCLAPSRSRFTLTVWCDEREALPQVLARFWGA